MVTAYIYIQQTGTPEEFQARMRESERWCAENPEDPEEEEEELEHLAQSWDEIEEDIARGNADIEGHRASRVLDWRGSTSHPNTISRTFFLPSGGAVILNRAVEPGQAYEEVAEQADEAFRAEGWPVPVADRYEVVQGARPGGGFFG